MHCVVYYCFVRHYMCRTDTKIKCKPRRIIHYIGYSLFKHKIYLETLILLLILKEKNNKIGILRGVTLLTTK